MTGQEANFMVYANAADGTELHHARESTLRMAQGTARAFYALNAVTCVTVLDRSANVVERLGDHGTTLDMGSVSDMESDLSLPLGMNPEWCAEADRMKIKVHLLHNVLWDIAHMSTKPRPDGTFNYSREAIIDIARKAIQETQK